MKCKERGAYVASFHKQYKVQSRPRSCNRQDSVVQITFVLPYCLLITAIFSYVDGSCDQDRRCCFTNAETTVKFVIHSCVTREFKPLSSSRENDIRLEFNLK